MAEKNSKSKKMRPDWRKIVVSIMAVLMALLMIIPMITMIVGSAGAVTQSEIDALKEDQGESRSRQQELKEQLAELKDDQSDAEQKRKILTQQLNEIYAEIESINKQIELYDGQIEQKEAERVVAVAKEEEQYAVFCKRVRAMEEDGNISYWSILFNAEDFSDMLSKLGDVNDVMDYDNAVMNQLMETRRQIEQLKTELEQARTEQEAAKAVQEERRQEQAAKVAEVKLVLDKINANTAEVNRLLDQEEAAAAEISASIAKKQRQMEEERRRNNVTIESETGYMWPLPGIYRLTSFFGYRIHPISKKPQSHTGIDVPAAGGTAILAAKSGQVVTSDYHYSYGNYVVIDHGNGNSTLYAHMSARSVSEGQMVTQGQTVGKVGTTGSSTGNHLHFEVRDNYSRVDPQRKFPSISFGY